MTRIMMKLKVIMKWKCWRKRW